MGINYRKRVTIGNGVKLNLSKNGISTTFGSKGGSINIGKDGVYANASFAGTGLYSRQKISSSTKNVQGLRNSGDSTAYEWVMNICLVFSMLLFIVCVLFPHMEKLPYVLIPAIVAQVIFWLMWLCLKDYVQHIQRNRIVEQKL